MPDKPTPPEMPSTQPSQKVATPGDSETAPVADPQLQALLAKLPHPAGMVGPYELMRRLGQGGMGEVWLAQHTTSRRLVALKLLRQDKFDSIERYLLVRREIEAQANLVHPHIVPIVDVGLPALHLGMTPGEIRQQLTASPMYVAFAFVEDARTLQDLLGGDRPSYERIAELIIGLAEALAYAHQQGVYHLDVKPSNVLIGRDGQPLLADFGLSTLARGRPPEGAGGTRRYMSPERLRSNEHHHSAADIWSLGVVFYQLLTREHPFPNVADITDERFQSRPIRDIDPDAPELFVELCGRCLERDLANRCHSASEVARSLRAWLAARRGRTTRIRATLIGFASLALIAMMAGIGLTVARLAGRVGGVSQRLTDVGQGVEKFQQQVESYEQATRQESRKTLDAIQKLYEDPDVLAAKLKSHIRKRADEQIAGLRRDSSNWRKIDEIEQQRDQQLDRVDQLVTTIRQGLAGDPDPIFAEAARILAAQGVDEAIAYLQTKQPAIEKQVNATKARRDEAQLEFRRSLQPWLLEAQLYETNLAWDDALHRYEKVAGEAPDWSHAHYELGMLLKMLARYSEAESQLQAALQLAGDDDERCETANGLGLVYYDTAQWNRAEPLLRQALELSEKRFGPNHPETAAALSNLGLLLHDTNRLAEAEPLYRRAVAIDERRLGPEARPPTESRAAVQPAQQGRAAHLLNLAGLLKDTNRLAEAEPLFRQALAIDEATQGPAHPDVARDLNNLARLLQEDNRLLPAETLMRRALAIWEQSLGPENPHVATAINNLAMMLNDENRLAETEPLYRRALAIWERSLGTDHPQVAAGLGNLAQLLKDLNRLSDAEPLMRGALVIDERSFGADHPNIANDLNNLARLLQATNRLTEAEPLMRRALEIDEQSYGPQHPLVAIRLNNLALLLQATHRVNEAEPLMRRALAIVEQSYGTQHPEFAIRLHNLAWLLKDMDHLTEAEQLMRCAVGLLHQCGQRAGVEHPGMQVITKNYRYVLRSMKMTDQEINERMRTALEVPSGHEPGGGESGGPTDAAAPVRDILAALDEQIKKTAKSPIYFLAADQPLSPQLSKLLGPSKLAPRAKQTLCQQIDALLGPAKLSVGAGEPIAPQLERLLGPSKLTVPAEKPLSPYLDQSLGRPQLVVPLDEPVSPHLDQLLGPSTDTQNTRA